MSPSDWPIGKLQGTYLLMIGVQPTVGSVIPGEVVQGCRRKQTEKDRKIWGATSKQCSSIISTSGLASR